MPASIDMDAAPTLPNMPRSWARIMGYAFEADTYCVLCTQVVYGYVCPDVVGARRGIREGTCCPMLDENGISFEQADSEGNLLSPLFGTDDPQEDEFCVGCRTLIREGTGCPCGDGCDRGDCSACGDDLDRDEYDPDDNSGRDWNEPANSCTCMHCMAAAAWQPEVE